MRRFLASNFASGAAIAAIALLLAVAAREAGFFERSDLAIHDRLVRHSMPAIEDDRFVIVLESEQDLRRWKYPLSDEVLATLLTHILEAQPAAIAVDKYRDVPVEPGSERLSALLRGADRVYWVRKFGTKPADDVPAPAALDAKYVGCGDLVDDRDGMVRRGLLYVDDGQRFCYSLGLKLAQRMAAGQGLSFSPPKDDPDRFDLGKSHLRALESCDGPYAYVDTAGFQAAVPSAANARFRRVGLSDVLDGKIPPEVFRGKAVLIGSGAESLGDFFNAPSTAPEGYDKVNGVSMHATIAAHLLSVAEGRSTGIRLVPRWGGLALGALFAFAAGLVSCARRSLPLTLAGFVVAGVILAFAAVGLASQGLYAGVTAAAVAMSLAFVAGIVRSEWLERRERAELMSLFGRHVSREVAEDLWRKRDEYFTHGMVRPQQIVATMFFLDIRGFTTVSETLDPTRVVGWLNRGLTAIIGEITRHNGVVTRFAGDAVMAVFGSPVAREVQADRAADAANAIDAALAIGPALDALNARYDVEGLPHIRVRIGINTGQVMQCSVGASDRAEFTVLGDAVNTASRLESFEMEDRGESARVIIGEETFNLAGSRYETQLVGSIKLKGKENLVTLRQVSSRR